MKKVLMTLATICALFGLGAQSFGATSMVAVRANLVVDAPDAGTLQNAREFMLTVEGEAMDQLFDVGDIAFNSPAQLDSSAAPSQLASDAALMAEAVKAGADELVIVDLVLAQAAKSPDIRLQSYSVALHPLAGVAARVISDASTQAQESGPGLSAVASSLKKVIAAR